MLDPKELVESYLLQKDWRVKENSNQGYSFSGLSLHVSSRVISEYVLNHIYPKEISDLHRKGAIHIHDLGQGIVCYCCGWSLRNLLTKGFGGVSGYVDSKPPKHLDSAVWQMINFLGTMQNENAGAQAFNSVDTYLAAFIKKDKLDYKQVKQCIQALIYNSNIPSRWGGQAPFINLTFDLTVPEDLADQGAIVGGEVQDFTYGDLQEEMDMINKAFLEIMLEGDALGRPFTFPIPTYNITKDFDWDSEISDLLFKVTGKYGIPYFQNFVNSDLNPRDIRSMCCRLQLDLKELRNKMGGLFGAGEQTGSIGVVTINLPQIGYLAKDEDEFFEILDERMDLAKECLEIKRKVITENLKRGLMPYTKVYLGSFDHHFSTIGLLGMNEACLNLLGVDIADNDGHSFAIKVMDHMRERIKEYQEETGNLYNLEATPAESTCYRLARIDKKNYPDIIVANENTSYKETGIPYYTNSTHLPPYYTDDLFFTLNHQEPLQSRYTGGTVLHIYLDEPIGGEEAKLLIKKLVHGWRIPYYSISPRFSICPVHGYIPGWVDKCPY